MLLQALLGSLLASLLWGIDVGNGGDVLRCTSHPVLRGLYVLDYLVHPDGAGVGGELVAVRSWPESRQRLAGILRRLPHLGHSFARFAELVLSDDPRYERLWIPSRTALRDLPTEELRNLPPAGCYQERDGHISFLQAVVREASGPAVRYYYDQSLLAELETAATTHPERALQYSMLLVHEWLWDFFARGQSEELRLVNRFLHSAAADRYGADELWDALHHLGMDEEDLGPRPGTSQTGTRSADALVAGTGFVCALVTGRVSCWGIHAPAADALTGVSHIVASSGWLCYLQAGRLGCVPDRTGTELPSWLRSSPLARRPLRAIAGGGGTLCGQLDDRLACHVNGAVRLSEHPLLAELEAAAAHGSLVCMASATRLFCPGQLDTPLRRLRHLAVHGSLACTIDETGAGCRSWLGHVDHTDWLGEHGAEAALLAPGSTGPCLVRRDMLTCRDQQILGGQEVPVRRATALVSLPAAACVLEAGAVRCFGSNDGGILDVPEVLWPSSR
jgi:hypothetical protein